MDWTAAFIILVGAIIASYVIWDDYTQFRKHPTSRLYTFRGLLEKHPEPEKAAVLLKDINREIKRREKKNGNA